MREDKGQVYKFQKTCYSFDALRKKSVEQRREEDAMARPLRIAYPGAYYHVSSRGNEQKDVFKSRKDREKFLDYLASATQRYGAVIHVYCLMTNHYHLLKESENL